MHVNEQKVTKLLITEVDGLDPISVYFEDLAPGKGKFIIECFGAMWSHGWNAMGKENKISTFFLGCSEEYLADKCGVPIYQTDFEALSKQLGHKVHCMADIESNESFVDKMEELYDSRNPLDCSLPTRKTDAFIYFCRIVKAIKEAILITNTSVAV